MAQAELNITIDKMSGKIYGESDVYITHRYGKTVISHYPKHRDPAWQQRYNEYKANYNPKGKYYFTLRGFVIAQLSKQISK